MTVCPSCGEQTAPRLAGHHCPAVWRTCNICGDRYRVDREVATFLREYGVSECPSCSPGLHRRYG